MYARCVSESTAARGRDLLGVGGVRLEGCSSLGTGGQGGVGTEGESVGHRNPKPRASGGWCMCSLRRGEALDGTV